MYLPPMYPVEYPGNLEDDNYPEEQEEEEDDVE